MSFLSASFGLTRYRVSDAVPDELWPEVDERLKKFAFRDIDNTAEERSFGWTSFDDFLDTEWKTAPPEIGSYLAFALRLDTRRVPAAVLKKHLRLALDEELDRVKSLGQKFIGKEAKTEIKERVMLSLRARTLPVPAFFQVIWDTNANLVYFDCTRDKVREMFEEHFLQTFGLNLEPQTPGFMAAAILGADRESELVKFEPASFA